MMDMMNITCGSAMAVGGMLGLGLLGGLVALAWVAIGQRRGRPRHLA
jgi:hypothetical protein